MSPDLAKHQAELASLCRRHGVRRLALFGSAATGTYRTGESDLDFLVDFEPSSPTGFSDRYFELLESLQQLFGTPVDLVVESAIHNPYFRQSIEQSKTDLYAA